MKRWTRHGQSGTRLYGIWCRMKTRCNCPTARAYSYYGGRGIKVCQAWSDSFESFRVWAEANGYRSDLELDRIDVNGGYSPDNCRFATRSQQMRNTRKRRNAKTSKYKGVHLVRSSGRWRAFGYLNGKPVHIGCFATEKEAASAYDRWAGEHYGEFAHVNFA